MIDGLSGESSQEFLISPSLKYFLQRWAEWFLGLLVFGLTLFRAVGSFLEDAAFKVVPGVNLTENIHIGNIHCKYWKHWTKYYEYYTTNNIYYWHKITEYPGPFLSLSFMKYYEFMKKLNIKVLNGLKI